MQIQPDPPSDAERVELDVLKRCRLDGPGPEAAFDRVMRFAAGLSRIAWAHPRDPASLSHKIRQGFVEVPTAPALAGFGWRETRGDSFGKPTPAKDVVARRAAPTSREVA